VNTKWLTPRFKASSTSAIPVFSSVSVFWPLPANVVTAKTPWMGFWISSAAAKMAGTSLKSPAMSLMEGDLACKAVAEAEVGLRVTARIVKEEEWEGELMRASMVAPPCWPVAPVMRRALDIVGF
jgi:hypothetical protein